ncbi:esterase E4-like [Pectinophora gossypiella]|uniref:esterase E4-like n=1 Tax=Pectinophora gossypiella TaxID=13191 RepID=UPI00214E9DD8|nr:esterase E4-like [Pectinophora gossypiella]
MRLIFYVVLCTLELIKHTECVEVESTHGKVSGKLLKTLLKEVEYHGFMGIPYAAPPLKDLRFLPPRPVDPWPGVLSATSGKIPCIQHSGNVKRGQRIGSYGTEDCLYLDIFTPAPDNNKRPVIVFLHNEYLKYAYNKTRDYAPDFFIEEDVVIATISHRLSVLGFLSLDDEVLQGNAGLKDIVTGLEWIRNNADRFGGDRNRITLMGSQGGAVAVDLLIHSNARKLFNSAILQGGTSWASMYLQDKARERAVKLAEIFEIHTKNSERLLKELCDIPPKDLLVKDLEAVPKDYNKENQRSLLPFGPIVEREGGLVTDYPERSSEMDVPVMIGFNSREGLEKSLQYLIEPKYLSFAEKDFVLIMPEREDYRFDPEDEAYYDAVKDIKNFYFPKGKVTIRRAPEYVTYIGDVFTVPIDSMTKHYAKISSEPVYYYHFDLDSDLNENKKDVMRLSTVADGTWGAAAGDELCYLFKCPRLKDNYLRHHKKDSEEISFIRKMVRMWTNFAKHGNPTPEGDIVLGDLRWPPYTTDNKEYLHIDRTITIKQNLNKDRFQFWQDFSKKWKKKAVNGVVVSTSENKRDEL